MKHLFLILCLLAMARPVFAEYCSTAPENQPCTPDPGDATKNSKSAILDSISAAQQMTREVTALESQYRQIRANPNATPEEKLGVFEQFRTRKLAQDQLYKAAIDKTLRLYHVHPNIGE